METLTHELFVDKDAGFAEVMVEVRSSAAKRRVLQAIGAPESKEWSCKVFVTLEYEALTDEARMYNPLGEGGDTHDRQINAFDQSTHRGGE